MHGMYIKIIIINYKLYTKQYCWFQYWGKHSSQNTERR